MQNEIILFASLILIYSTTLALYKFLGTTGLYVWTAIATICANIEVLILIDAFGMEQTLGNILFASTFLVSDILSEVAGKKQANKAVKIGIVTSFSFIFISQSWFLYLPNANDWASPALYEIFSNTPRLLLVGIGVYAIAQVFDVWFYHFIWSKTTKIFGNSSSGLWIRNNGSTLVSQAINSLLFNVGAFGGIYDWKTILNISLSCYVVFIVTSLLDTPVIYLARRIKPSEIDT